MIVRHNTNLLEKAIQLAVDRADLPSRLAEAEMALKKQRERSKFWLAIGASVAIAAIGLGIAAYLSQKSHVASLNSAERSNAAQAAIKTQSQDQSTSPQSSSSQSLKTEPNNSTMVPKSGDPSVPGTPNSQGVTNPIVTDFTKFNHVTVNLLNQQWKITAGHQYSRAEDKDWVYAWCYTSIEVENVLIQVDLARRKNMMEPPTILIANTETYSKAALNDATAAALARKCPWADGKSFNLSEFNVTPNRKSIFLEKEPTFELVNKSLFVEGPITENFFKKVSSFNFDNLIINSPGGLVSESLLVANWLFQNNKITIVKEACFSACVYVVAGGRQRFASKNAKIGVHQFSTTSNISVSEAVSTSQQLSSSILAQLKLSGISDEMFYKVSKVPSDDIEIIDHATLFKWQYLTAELPDGTDLQGFPSPSSTSTGEDRSKISFESKIDFDLPGNDLPDMPVRDTSQIECENLCRANTSCSAYTFDGVNKACFLKSKATILMTQSSAVSGFRSENTILPENPFATDSRSLLDGKPYTVIENTNYGACLLTCFNEQQCKGLSYNTKTTQCLFFDSFNEAFNRSNWVSGVKAQN